MDVPQKDLLDTAKAALSFIRSDRRCEALAAAIEAVESAHGNDPETVTFREAAGAEYANDEVEIDDDAMISRSDNGAFVQAWVWVSNEEAGVEGESDEEDDEIVVEG